jgi:outer membrane lipoprotein-sorting protein
MNLLRSTATALLAALLLGAALPSTGVAAPPRSVQLSPDEQADVQRVQQYLNSIRTMTARFVQYGEDGSTAQGQLSLSRPDRMRFEYDPPAPILLMANGYSVIYFDKQLQQTTYLPISSTPAWFLLRDDIKLGGDVTITKFEHGPGVIRITLVQTKEPDAGMVTLTFSDKPLELKQWVITDPQGKRTTVALTDVRTGIPVDPKLFVFQEPTHR